MAIAKESGLLYDKFVGFTDDLTKVGNQLNTTQETYKAAMGKLTTSTRFGDTIIGRMENIKRLGANATKNIDKRLLDRVNIQDELVLGE